MPIYLLKPLLSPFMQTRSLLVRFAALSIVATFLPLMSAQAAVEVLETMLQLSVKATGQSAASDVFRQGSRSDNNSFFNPTLNNNLVGTSPSTPKFVPANGDVLQLKRVFIKSNHWNGGDIPAGAPNNNNWIAAEDNVLGMWYSVTPAGGADNWQFVQVARTRVEGHVQEWNANTNINLLSGLADGIYTLKVYFEIGFNSWDGSVVVGKTFDGSALVPTGSATFQLGEPPPDNDADGIPDAEDPDDDNDGLLDTVETNTGTWTSPTDTGTNPRNDDTDGDGLKDNVETNTGAYVSATNTGSNPLVADQPVVYLVGNEALFPGASWQVANPSNILSPATGGAFNVKSTTKPIATPGEIEFKFTGGNWDVNWGVGSNAVTAVNTNDGTANGILFKDKTPTAEDRTANVKVHRARGEYIFTFNDATNSLAFSVARKTYANFADYVTAYGLTGPNAESAADPDEDDLDNQAEYAANTAPDLGDSDGDGLSDAEEIGGNFGVVTNPTLRDTDGDGLLDFWELSNNLNPTDPTGNNGADGDPDNDGASNLVEQANGTDPNWAGTGFSSPYTKITIPGSFSGWNVEGNWENSMKLVGNNAWGAMILVTTNTAAPTNQFKFAPGSYTGSWGRGPVANVAVKGASENLLSTNLSSEGYYRFDFNDFTGVYSIARVSGGADTNSNGLPDAYESWYGAQLVPPVTTLEPSSDPDGDGLTILQEFNSGGNPVLDVTAPTLAFAPGVDRISWYAVGATIPAPAITDVIAGDDSTNAPVIVTITTGSNPSSSTDGFNVVTYRAQDASGNFTRLSRLIAIGNAAPGYWNLRFPATMGITTTGSNFAYGEIFIDGATAGAGQATGVQAWVGVNSANTDPSTWEESAWTSASYISDEGNNDNYQGLISGTNRDPGTYYYATRFRLGTNTSNTNFFFGGITTNGTPGNAWGTVLSTNTNGVVTTNVFGNGVLTVSTPPPSRSVTFSVDMGVQIFKGVFNPDTNGVEVRGDFNGFSGGSALSRQGSSSIYSGTFTVEGTNGAAQGYKFYGPGTNGLAWEQFQNNRPLTLESTDQTLSTVFFNNVSESRKITFRVDMSVQATKGSFNTNTGVVHVAGSFNGWSTTATPLTAQGNGIYGAEVTVDGPLSGLAYKFINGNTVGGYEQVSDRTISAALPNLASSTLDPVLFNNDDGVAPTDITLSASSIAENNAVNAVVGNLSSNDATAGDTHTYSLVAGVGDTDNGTFNISGNSLRASAVFDFETRSSYSVRVRSTDSSGNSFEKAFVISVTDVVEGTNFTSWSGGSAETNSANLLKYAIGGASNLTATDGTAPVTSVTSSNLSITAIVRTDDPKLEVVGETVTNLTGTWSTSTVTVSGAAEGVSQSNVGSGLERKTFSVERGSDTRKFLRIKSVLNP
jgi:Bacterial TSP3 repeat